MRFAVIGVGAVGARAARQLASTDGVTRLVLADVREDRATAIARSLGAIAHARRDLVTGELRGGRGDLDVDVAVLATPPGTHLAAAEALLERGVDVVSTTSSVDDVQRLLGLDAEARERGRHVVVGAGFAPGLTDVLAAHAAATFDGVDEVHVAKVGTGGPACARQHHEGLADAALDWRDGAWQHRRGGSGRELCWFPDPVGAKDCYRAALPDALLLVPAFPGVRRATARVAANRRDRFTAHLPMLRPPHPEGGLGAVRVEVRGRQGTARDVVVFGAVDRPAVAAGAVAAVAARLAASGGLGRHGAAGLATLVEPVPFLAELARRGVKAAVFDGSVGAPAGA